MLTTQCSTHCVQLAAGCFAANSFFCAKLSYWQKSLFCCSNLNCHSFFIIDNMKILEELEWYRTLVQKLQRTRTREAKHTVDRYLKQMQKCILKIENSDWRSVQYWCDEVEHLKNFRRRSRSPSSPRRPCSNWKRSNSPQHTGSHYKTFSSDHRSSSTTRPHKQTLADAIPHRLRSRVELNTQQYYQVIRVCLSILYCI